MLKLLSIFAALTVATVPDPTLAQAFNASNRATVNISAVRLLRCRTNKGVARGTGFIIARNVMVTANHVSSGRECSDASRGRTITPFIENYPTDFSLLTGNFGIDAQLPYSCGGMVEGRRYISIGFRNGTTLVQNTVLSSIKQNIKLTDGSMIFNLRRVQGTIIPGMSGGPVADYETGIIVAINTATNFQGVGWVRELGDTPLCGKAINGIQP